MKPEGWWTLQRMVATPVLLGAPGGGGEGHKFTVRVNVLCVGRLAVYVHRDASLLHVAADPYVARDWSNRFVHITNNSVQRSNPRYDPLLHTIPLPDADDAIAARGLRLPDGSPVPGSDAPGALFRAVCECTAALFAAVLTARNAEFWPIPNAFEVFGVDVLFDGALDRPVVLEVNEGPALGSLARPESTQRIVEDIWRCAVDPWLHAAREKGQEPETRLPQRSPPFPADPDASEWPWPVPDTAWHLVLAAHHPDDALAPLPRSVTDEFARHAGPVLRAAAADSDEEEDGRE
jgi:hypothetical protein